MLWRDTQILAMAVMFLTGVSLILFYDICGIVSGRAKPPGRSKRRPSGRPRWSFWDVAFWVVATPVVFAASLISNQGELRIYVFIGLGLGVVGYLLLARPFVVTVGAWIRETLIRTGVATGRAVAKPVRATGRHVGRASKAVTDWGRGRAEAIGGGLGHLWGWGRGRGQAMGRNLGQAGRRTGAGLGAFGRRILGGFRPKSRE